MKVHKTRYPELGYAKISLCNWRHIDTSSGSAVGPHYHTEKELLADLSRYAADFGCAEPAAFKKLPAMPERGCVQIDEWEPVPDKPGYVRRKRWLPVREVRDALAAVLSEVLPEEFGKLDYFSTRLLASESVLWPEGVIACFPVVGGNEGWYFHVDILTPRTYETKAEKWHTPIVGKTLEEGPEGFAIVSRLAAACAYCLGA